MSSERKPLDPVGNSDQTPVRPKSSVAFWVFFVLVVTATTFILYQRYSA